MNNPSRNQPDHSPDKLMICMASLIFTLGLISAITSAAFEFKGPPPVWPLELPPSGVTNEPTIMQRATAP